MNIVFMGGKQGGMIGLLSLCSYWEDPEWVIAYDEMVSNLSEGLIIRTLKTIKDIDGWYPFVNDLDLLVSIHGREIASNKILSKFKYGGINLHPMLSKYKGANPVARFLADSYQGKTDNIASVGCHRMTDELDGGEVLSEKFIKIDEPWNKSVVEIYNELYPLYPLVLMEAIQKVCC